MATTREFGLLNRIGIDVGSKTIKVVVLDGGGNTVHSVYRRHRSDVKSTLSEVLHELTWQFGDIAGTVGVTGSAGIGISEMLGLPFVQEVVAVTKAVQRTYPQADAIIELGGEDAKLVYLTHGLEQRMNATCAGGTGGFIDTIAFMIGSKSSEISKLALGAKRIYPISSRCAVFAQTDIRPLLNRGAETSDIAASALEAVVRQTLGGLACGRPIEGTVVFLGGPMEHIPELVRRFRSALGLTVRDGIKPIDAHLFTARGAALFGAEAWGKGGGRRPPVSLLTIEGQLARLPALENDLGRLPRLFESEEDYASFKRRHALCKMPRVRLFDCEGPLYLGIDAGSTAVKIAVLDERGRLAYSEYRQTGGEVLQTTIDMLKRFYAAMPRAVNGVPYVHVAHAVACGYGEEVLKAGLGIDSGVVETLAHARAARMFQPDLTFLLDIGGQDMKAIWVHEGRVTDAVLNEACSSGCGSFVEGTAYSLRSTPDRFSDEALFAQSPVDLGAKCTVFMTSRVRHAQKVGVAVSDIAAGIAYSVVRNALFRIIGAEKLDTLGDCVVVQGGAFMSDAVLRAFELVSGTSAIRPDTAHLMGAVGAALTARSRAQAAQKQGGEGVRSGLVEQAELNRLSPVRRSMRCPGCGNGCPLSLVDFGEGRLFISGNRCGRAYEAVGAERGVGARRARRPPNVVALGQKLLRRFSSADGSGRRAHVRIGIMNTLYLYAQMPFWHAFFEKLGFSIAVPDDRRAEAGGVAREGAATVPSESVCHSAKLTHMRLYDLFRNGRADVVFMPRYVREGRCPVVCGYAGAVADCTPVVREGEVLLVSPMLRGARSIASADDDDDRYALLESINDVSGVARFSPVTAEELEAAIASALEAQEKFERTVSEGNVHALAWAHGPGRRGVVLGGHPYHSDPAVMHGIDNVLADLGFAVLFPSMSDASEADRGSKGDGSWGRESRLAELARLAASDPALEFVGLQSFGCAYDAVSLPYARKALEGAGKSFTSLKIDGIADTAHVRIRLRTLAEALEGGGAGGRAEATELDPSAFADSAGGVRLGARCVHLLGSIEKKDIDVALRAVPDGACFVAKALAGRAIRMANGDRSLSAVRAPRVCSRCVLDAVPDIVAHAIGRNFDVCWTDEWPSSILLEASRRSCSSKRPRVGLVGNALFVFDVFMNNGIVDLIEREGCEVVLPRPEGLFVDDARYLSELNRFVELGVDHVIYLQAFGCLKGHVHARGALHGLAKRYPNMSFTVIDYDPEASALNRENRVLLAVEAAKRSFFESASSAAPDL
ncbi:hypothetical protein C1878_04580 [Gordonibacter sp. 28C]|uniref:BadF/BadG/BcrA/BcrD ATPase family protein n=1 Tax=Gordonibacter sp. 28C TaxID=2078569 RepID=UPI000DF7953A|nr:BadF/BadG/BcrA/BcrD ATPase family protein [Gordonibacter sp. 28C]RDB63148.1 hypothetical protein C1878_04580 [Gordonibacter sp. 28C]